MNSSVAFCCTCFQMASCASGTSASGQSQTCYQLATLFSAARRGCDSADRTRQVRRRQRERSLALPKCAGPMVVVERLTAAEMQASFSTSGHRCPMKQLSPTQIFRVSRHAPSPYCLIAEQIFFFWLPSRTPLRDIFRDSQFPSASYHPLRSAAQSRRTATPALHSIQFP